MSRYEAIIKVNLDDPTWKRGRDIADGLGYACALLMDEYEWTADGIADALERVIDEIRDTWDQRHPDESPAGLADDGTPL